MTEYIPSWQRKPVEPSAATLAPPPPPPAAPAATAHKPSGISVTNTATNSSRAYGGAYPSYGTPVQSAQRAAANSPKDGGSPELTQRIPVRMSPAIQPSVNLNVNADAFVPGRGGGMGMHALEELPSSTAEMEKPAPAAKAVAAAPYKPAAWTPSHQQRATASPLITHVTLGNLTDEEIHAISQRSTLKLSAATYSSKRTLTRLIIVSPITLMPTAGPRAGAELDDDDDDAERNLAMMLDDLWCLFYLPQVGESIKEDTYNPTLVFRIDSVPTFWKVVNNIPQPTQLPQCTLYLFRDGIDPRWEDPANLSGGIVRVKINHSHSTVFNSYTADPNAADSQEKINEAWELLLCRTIGNSWSSSVRKLVNGIALKVRGRAYVLEVWVTRQTQELMRDLAELWQGVLGDAFATAYYPHSALQERSHQAATAMAAKKAQQQQQQQGRRHHK